MIKDIIHYNEAGQWHGYQERYSYYKLWYRSNYIKDLPIGYFEWHSNMYEHIVYYIR